MSEHVRTFTEQTWQKDALSGDQPVLVDFWAQWCKPCLAMAPDLEAVAEQYRGRAVVGKVNAEEFGELAGRYNVTAMPTILVLKKGRVVEQRVGKLSKDALVKLIEPHLG
jgi:thioredoxin 1